MAKIEIANPTNAFVCITSKSERIVIDPWVNDGIYEGTWHNFPRISENERDLLLEGVRLCLITHLHKDHFSIETIRHLDKSTHFVFPKVFGWQVIENNLCNEGYKNTTVLDCITDEYESSDFVIKAVSPINIGGLEEQPNPELLIDGGFVLTNKQSGLKLVFLADNNLYSSHQIAKNFESLRNPDLIAFAYSGFASDYPFNYDFTLNEKIEIMNQSEQKRFDIQRKNLATLNPKFVLPYSSEFVPVGIHSKGWTEVFPHIFSSSKDEVAQRYSAALSVDADSLYPNEVLIFDGVNRLPIKKVFDREMFLSNLLEYYRVTTESLPQSLSSEFNLSETREMLRLAAVNCRNAARRHKLSPKQNINFSINEKYVGSLLFDNLEFSRERPVDGNQLDVNSKPEIFMDLMRGKIHWNDAILSLRLNWHRMPNIYCPETLSALNYLKM